mgnify:CR=1 FL=1
MRFLGFLVIALICISAGGDKAPRKHRGVFQGTMTSFQWGSGDQVVEVSGALVRITISKYNALVELEGEKFEAPLKLSAVTKSHVTYKLDLPFPLTQSSLRIERKGKKMEWINPVFEDVILVK